MRPISEFREALDNAAELIPDTFDTLSVALDELEGLREHVRILSGPARRLKHLDGLPDHDYCALAFSGAELRALLAALAATEPKDTP